MNQPQWLFSSDLNGTLVCEHTMSDMIRIYLGQEKFRKADEVFKKQVIGQATMQQAFIETAGPLTEGLTIKQAVGYTREHMSYVQGMEQFMTFLYAHHIPLVINSTGYSVTVYSIMEYWRKKSLPVIHGHIGNCLRFKLGDEIFSENRLAEVTRRCYSVPFDPVNDWICADGTIELGLENEQAKAEKIIEYARQHFPGLPSSRIIHMGDTFGDSGGILGVAKAGGIGIAFNYNSALKDFLEKALRQDDISGQIYFMNAKGVGQADLKNVVKLIEEIV